MQCKGDWCRIKVNGKWQIVNGAQQASLSAGIVSGIPMPIGESLEELIHIATSPVETYKAIKSLINSGDILGNVSAVLKQEYSKRIDNLIAQYEKAGASGSYKAGVEIGKLLTDIGTIAAGGVGIGKGVAKVTNKVVGKLSKEAARANSVWNSWQSYPKVLIGEKQYAKIGGRLYSQHAVDRMQPSGLGSPAGTVGTGRNISPNMVDHVIKNGTQTRACPHFALHQINRHAMHNIDR